MPEIEIREATAEDRDFVLALVPELNSFGPPPWRDVPHLVAVDDRVLRDALYGRSPGAVVYIALDGGERLGFIHLVEEDDYYAGPCGHIGDVVVSPSAQGRGVGKALMEAAERWARNRGYGMLSLNVFLINTRARAVYEALGYEPETMRYLKFLKDPSDAADERG